MKIFRYLISAVTAAACLSGCIWEDRSDCACDVILAFRYYGDGDTDIFRDKIGKVNLYVYSADGHSLEGEYSFDAAALAESQGTHLQLRPGDYRIVCWGNVLENTRVHTVYDEAKVAEPGFFGQGQSFSGTDDLYFSSIEITVPETLADVVDTCMFECSHIDMMLKLKGFKGAIGARSEDGSITVTHKGCPAYTDFHNVPSREKCDVVPELKDDPDEADSYILEYKVLRFSENENTSIVLTGGDGRELYSLSVPQFIDTYGLELDGKQEAGLSIRIILGPTGISMEEWNIEDVTPGFDYD